MIKRDKYYYVQHLIDMDTEDAAKKLLNTLEVNTKKWTEIYDPQLNGNAFGWYPSATLPIGEYAIVLQPTIYREGNQFTITSVEIYLNKVDVVGKKRPKTIKQLEEPLNISSPNGREWDFSSLNSTLNNLVRATKELIKKDYD